MPRGDCFGSIFGSQMTPVLCREAIVNEVSERAYIERLFALQGAAVWAHGCLIWGLFFASNTTAFWGGAFQKLYIASLTQRRSGRGRGISPTTRPSHPDPPLSNPQQTHGGGTLRPSDPPFQGGHHHTTTFDPGYSVMNANERCNPCKFIDS